MSQDPLRYFRVEARELVDQISAGVLDLDQQPGPDLVARLLRFAHTLKGAARVVRQQDIADRAHAFEEVLVPHRTAGDPLSADQMRELLRLNDEIEARVAALEPQSSKPNAPLRFPAGMTPGGPSPSPRSRPAGGRSGPGATPDPRTAGSTGIPSGSPPHAPSGPATGTQAGRRGTPGGEVREPASAGLGHGPAEASAEGQQATDVGGATTGHGPAKATAEGQQATDVRGAATGQGPSGQSKAAADLSRQGAAAAGGRSAGQETSGEPEAASSRAVEARAADGSAADVDRRPSTARGPGPTGESGLAGEPAPTEGPGSAGETEALSGQTGDGGSQPREGKAATPAAGAGNGPASSTAAESDSGPAPASLSDNSERSGDKEQTSKAERTDDSERPMTGAQANDEGQATAEERTGDSGRSAGTETSRRQGQAGGDSRQEPFPGHPSTAPAGYGSGQPATSGEETTKAPSHTESTPAARGATADVDELLDAVGEAHARFAPLRSGGHALDRLTRAAEALADQLRVGRTTAHTDAARGVAARLASDLGALGRRITDTVEQVERELDEVRGRAERLRLVSASSIFTGLHRAVRDAADAQGKRVRFEGRGGDLRLDPQVLALANNALLHIVRNAVVHGIEANADRLAAGKQVEGRVVVEVERRGRFVAFRCTDDGQGFDLAAVRRTAEARGRLMPGGTPPDEQTLVELVLRGGISTSPTVTEVAGRGIGLDVARDVADQLGGDVSVRTVSGRGAVIELVLPLALMSLHGLIVEAAGTVATVPLDAVLTCVRLLPEQATAAAVTGKMAHDGEAVPFLPLARALYAGTTVPDGGGPTVAVVIGLDGEAVAVGVDRLAGTSTLVVRPLPDLAPAAPVIGGVSMDLDGNPRLVLDPQGLVAETLRLGGGGAAPDEPVRRLPILVVDDSLTTRMLERSILESAGYEVDLAASGEEGLELARSRHYGLYLTDIDMPGIDGFTFVAETRADPELAGVPAILVSSRASAEDRQRGAAVGASAYVVKGEFNQEELLAQIRRLVPA